jgi:hypothetical protein
MVLVKVARADEKDKQHIPDPDFEEGYCRDDRKLARAAQKTADRLKALEAENAELRNAIAAAKTAAPAAALRNTVAAKEHGIKLEWEILADNELEGYISAYEEPFGLYVRQVGDMFFWHVLKDNDEDADKDPVDVAEGDEPSMIAAMAAAEAAARHLIRGP